MRKLTHDELQAIAAKWSISAFHLMHAFDEACTTMEIEMPRADAAEAGQPQEAAGQAVGAWQPITWQEQEARYEQEMREVYALEKAAQALYEQWASLPGYVPWVEGGNSDRQEDARRLARAALTGSLGDGGGKG